MHYESWCALSDEELGRRDIAEVNLAAAFGLPHAGDLDIEGLRAKVDQWADLVRLGTKRAVRSRAKHLTYREHTDSQFRILVMVTILQHNLGVRYNLDFNAGEYDARDSRNLFIHGLLTGHGGTCCTMPVLYAAIGKRLGYPIKMVFAAEHVFCRWDDPRGERFNIEATSRGFLSHSDEHYHHFPKPLSAQDLGTGRFLRSLSPREELAYFLSQRGHCWRDHLQTARALRAFYWAYQLAPTDPAHDNEWAIATVMHRVVEATRQQSRDGMIPRNVRVPAPQVPWERRVYPVAQRQINRILANRRAKREPLASDQVVGELQAQS